DLPADQELVERLQSTNLESSASDGASGQHERDLGVLRRPRARAPLDQRQPHAPPIPTPSASPSGTLSRSPRTIVSASLPQPPIRSAVELTQRVTEVNQRPRFLRVGGARGGQRKATRKWRGEAPVSRRRFRTPIPRLGKNPTDPARVV